MLLLKCKDDNLCSISYGCVIYDDINHTNEIYTHCFKSAYEARKNYGIYNRTIYGLCETELLFKVFIKEIKIILNDSSNISDLRLQNYECIFLEE